MLVHPTQSSCANNKTILMPPTNGWHVEVTKYQLTKIPFI